ncbi:MAG: pentapeptide repeat-containing protein, partial [Cellulomonadaceae bacterium]|nr:pentapeptide repeat-containing protein [Cellulomonadaceae bacterium]
MTVVPVDPLRADCSRCFALCCVAPAFAASADFAIDKPAGRPCPNLADDLRCSIHDALRPRGFAGCVVYDCFGAGQHVSQVTFGGADWRARPGTAQQMFAVLPVVRALRELAWLVREALGLAAAVRVHPDLAVAASHLEELTSLGAVELVTLDLARVRGSVNPVLVQASDLARAAVRRDAPDRRGADLVGRDLRKADLRAASLRGALLLGADLR